MAKLILLLLVVPWLAASRWLLAAGVETVNDTEVLANSSDPNKDMYVINAMVYQVGIVTNKTDNETANMNATGNQETVTFYHTNGSKGLDLSKIPAPLLTNVTAQSMVGVAPVSAYAENAPNQLNWSTLNHLANLANMQPSSVTAGSETPKTSRKSTRSIDVMDLDSDTPFNKFYKSLFKRDVPVGNSTVSIHSGAAVIPQTAGIQSIALPPLLTLNTNLSDLPVPIPNTSVIHYAKINTLVSKN